MQFLTFLSIITVALAKNILLSNDDGWAATNIRAFYRDLKAAGHNVIMVAPATQRSGWGGKFDVPYTTDLMTDANFNYRNKGDPAWGHEEDDLNVWYFNGSTGACVSFGLEYVIPKYFNNVSIDLVVAGPNEGTNLGPGLYTLSGTMGATYYAVYNGIPGIAFSGSNSNNSFFKDSLDEDPLNPANINSKKSVEVVEQIFAGQGENPRALPLGVGLNVNLPPVGYDSKDESCTDPKFVYSRLNGHDSYALKVVYNETSGLVSTGTVTSDALNVCYNGLCDLPPEAQVLSEYDCSIAISAFQVDYDATALLQEQVKAVLNPIF